MGTQNAITTTLERRWFLAALLVGFVATILLHAASVQGSGRNNINHAVSDDSVRAAWLRDMLRIDSADVLFHTPEGFPAPLYDVADLHPTPAGFVVGRSLFYDPILSNDQFTSCASCHQQFAAFAHVDHALSHAVIGSIGFRNVPALQNLVWKDAFMLDGAINHLDMQPLAPLTNPIELNETLPNVLNKLRADSSYRELFRRAYGDTAITTKRFLRALSQFLVLMVSNGSRYDKMLKGEVSYTAEEKHGYEVFREHCTSCHAEPLMTDNSYRTIGLPMDTVLRDSGRARVTGRADDLFAFKVPSLRNVARTFPYMHDGRFRTLAAVMEFYRKGSDLPHDPALRSARTLTDTDIRDVITFLGTLTDTSFIRDRRFMDPKGY